MTQHAALCLGLTHLGASPQAAKGKYTIFRLGERYYFVGRAGALRVGFKASPASSRPCHDVFRQRVLDAPGQALARELTRETRAERDEPEPYSLEDVPLGTIGKEPSP